MGDIDDIGVFSGGGWGGGGGGGGGVGEGCLSQHDATLSSYLYLNSNGRM